MRRVNARVNDIHIDAPAERRVVVRVRESPGAGAARHAAALRDALQAPRRGAARGEGVDGHDGLDREHLVLGVEEVGLLLRQRAREALELRVVERREDVVHVGVELDLGEERRDVDFRSRHDVELLGVAALAVGGRRGQDRGEGGLEGEEEGGLHGDGCKKVEEGALRAGSVDCLEEILSAELLLLLELVLRMRSSLAALYPHNEAFSSRSMLFHLA